jgi:acetolactate synthase-1/2/3 large subunit
MKTHEALAQAFVAEGVEHAFGMMGDATLHWYAAMADAGVRMIDARQEIGAVAMAEGYAQVRGDVGVASVTSGPGLVQSGLALANAARAGAPTVLFAGNSPTTALEGPQLLDQRRFTEACGAIHVALRSPATALADVRRAFGIARTQRVAVVLDAPMDLQAADSPITRSDLDDYRPVRPSGVDQSAGVPTGAVLHDLLGRVRGARRPVVVAGRGAMSAGAHDPLLALAERIGAATATTALAKGYLDDDPYCLGVVGPLASAPADALFEQADLVIAFGASLDRFSVLGRGTSPVFPNAQVVSIGDTALRGAPSAHVHAHVRGDAAATASALVTALEAEEHGNDGFRTAAVTEALWSAERPATAAADGLLHPALAMEVLEPFLSDDAHRVVVGSGHFWSWPLMYLRAPRGGRFLFAHYFGSIGLALPVGIGAAVGDPSSRVVVVEGDGSIMETVQELETASRCGIAITTVVMNDQQLGAERFKGELAGLDPKLMHIPTPRFDEVARAFGGDGALVNDESGMRDALERAARSTGPFVIDARIDPSVVCDMYRKLHHGLPNVAPHQVRR